MFKDRDDPAGAAAETAAWFGNAEKFLSHGRPVRREEAREHGVVITNLEENDELQDAILSVHHATMHTLSGTRTGKLVENDQGRAWLQIGQVVQLQAPAGPPAKPAGPKRPPPPPRQQRGKRRR